VVDPRFQQEAMRRRSRGAVEEPGEVVWAHAGHRAEPGQREVLLQVGPYVVTAIMARATPA
jgi:hypothetical protein